MMNFKVDLVEHDERGTIYKIDEWIHKLDIKQKTIKHLKPLTVSGFFISSTIR